MNRPKYIILRLLMVVIPLLMTMAPAMAQNTVYAGQTTNLSVVVVPGETYNWDLYNDVNSLNLAIVPGNCPAAEAFFVGGVNTGPTVQVTWLVPGTYYWKVTATTSCTNNLAIGQMIVLNPLPTAVIEPPPPICAGDSVHLTVHLTGTAPWSFTLTDGVNTWLYSGINTNTFNLTVPVVPAGNTTYWITEVTDAYATNTTPSAQVVQVVNPRPVNSKIYQYGP
jgi:hypothetical protein